MYRSGGAIPYAIGINCTKVFKLRKLILQFEEAATKLSLQALPHLAIYPDGAQDLVYNTTTKQWVQSGDVAGATSVPPWHEELASIVSEVQERGKWSGTLVGGCCKTRPEHIAKLRHSLLA